MPRTKEQFEEIRKEKTKLISHAALELFASNGFHKTSITQIAKKANISKGLLYNYFESKSDLLMKIFEEIMENVMGRLNPNNHKELSKQDAELFIDNMIDVIVENPRDWKLYYQLMVQQEVMETLINENMMEMFLHNQKLLLSYFIKHEFNDPLVDILHFSSVYKGFALQFVFAPELFSTESINRFKVKMKELFIKPERADPNFTIELDETIGYLLL